MPRKKINKELWGDNPVPKNWDNDPEQFIYKTDKLQIIQNGLDSLPTLTISSVQLEGDVKKIISWVNDNDLSGGWSKWNTIIGNSFIELLKMPVEKQKDLYSLYKESMIVKLTNAIKCLKMVKKEANNYLQTIEKNMTSTVSPILENVKEHPDYLDENISYYEQKLTDFKAKHLGYYIFMKPYLQNVLKALKDDGKENYLKDIITNLFILFDVNDSSKIDIDSVKERVRSLLNKMN